MLLPLTARSAVSRSARFVIASFHAPIEIVFWLDSVSEGRHKVADPGGRSLLTSML
jgi:hypothetical protein